MTKSQQKNKLMQHRRQELGITLHDVTLLLEPWEKCQRVTPKIATIVMQQLTSYSKEVSSLISYLPQVLNQFLKYDEDEEETYDFNFENWLNCRECHKWRVFRVKNHNPLPLQFTDNDQMHDDDKVIWGNKVTEDSYQKREDLCQLYWTCGMSIDPKSVLTDPESAQSIYNPCDVPEDQESDEEDTYDGIVKQALYEEGLNSRLSLWPNNKDAEIAGILNRQKNLRHLANQLFQEQHWDQYDMDCNEDILQDWEGPEDHSVFLNVDISASEWFKGDPALVCQGMCQSSNKEVKNLIKFCDSLEFAPLLMLNETFGNHNCIDDNMGPMPCLANFLPLYIQLRQTLGDVLLVPLQAILSDDYRLISKMQLGCNCDGQHSEDIMRLKSAVGEDSFDELSLCFSIYRHLKLTSVVLYVLRYQPSFKQDTKGLSVHTHLYFQQAVYAFLIKRGRWFELMEDVVLDLGKLKLRQDSKPVAPTRISRLSGSGKPSELQVQATNMNVPLIKGCLQMFKEIGHATSNFGSYPVMKTVREQLPGTATYKVKVLKKNKNMDLRNEIEQARRQFGEMVHGSEVQVIENTNEMYILFKVINPRSSRYYS